MIFAVTEPNWSWAMQGTALVFLPLCLRSRLHGRHRFQELERVAAQRGWGIKKHHHLIFTDADLAEIELIKGRFMARAIRVLSRGVETM